MFLITSDFWRSFHAMSLYFLVGNVFRNNISKDGVESSTLKTFDWFWVSDVRGNTEHLSLSTQNQSCLSVLASPMAENEALSHQLSNFPWSKAIPSGWGWMVTPKWERNARGEEATRECREQWWESIPCKCGFSTSPCTLCVVRSKLPYLERREDCWKLAEGEEHEPPKNCKVSTSRKTWWEIYKLL